MSKFYLKFQDETAREAIESHEGDGFASIEAAQDFAFAVEESGKCFQVIDSNEKVLWSGMTTNEGVIDEDELIRLHNKALTNFGTNRTYIKNNGNR